MPELSTPTSADLAANASIQSESANRFADSLTLSTWTRERARVENQDWPTAALYVIATPIGNLCDLSLRAWQALRCCDVIAAEDTRVSRTLLQAWDVRTPLIAAHRHNEAQAAQTILAHLQAGARVGLISDAGAPAVSDPGGRIVAAVQAAQHRVIPIPGPSAVMTALMASGATSDANPAFAFAGFAPAKAGARAHWLRQWLALPAPVVLFESPHRLAALTQDLARLCDPQRRITLARELTKRFEQIVTLQVAHLSDWLAADAQRRQGEFVLIVHAAPRRALPADTDAVPPDARTLLNALCESLSIRDAARVAAKVTGIARNVLYQAALKRQMKTGTSPNTGHDDAF